MKASVEQSRMWYSQWLDSNFVEYLAIWNPYRKRHLEDIDIKMGNKYRLGLPEIVEKEGGWAVRSLFCFLLFTDWATIVEPHHVF